MEGLVSPLSSAFPLSGYFAGSSASSWSESISPTGAGQLSIILGIDWTATQAEPTQCWTHLEYGGPHIFYWDSQSTGEGLGVRWSWRGALYLLQGETITVVGTSSGPAPLWGGAWFGITVPGYPS